jgi:hypothetical protein
MRASKRPRERILHLGQCTPAHDRIPGGLSEPRLCRSRRADELRTRLRGPAPSVFDLSHAMDLRPAGSGSADGAFCQFAAAQQCACYQREPDSGGQSQYRHRKNLLLSRHFSPHRRTGCRAASSGEWIVGVARRRNRHARRAANLHNLLGEPLWTISIAIPNPAFARSRAVHGAGSNGRGGWHGEVRSKPAAGRPGREGSRVPPQAVQ